MTLDDYDQSWKLLKEAINQMHLSPTRVSHLSFEDNYRLVYWCVLYKYGEQLHMDLMIHLNSLEVKRYAQLDNTTDESFVVKFNKALVSTFSFIRLVCDIFMYLDRVFCRKELERNLHAEMIQTVGLLLPTNQLERLLSQLHVAGEAGRGVEQELLSSLSLHLHQLRPRHAPALFSLRWAAARLVAGRLGDAEEVGSLELPVCLVELVRREMAGGYRGDCTWCWLYKDEMCDVDARKSQGETKDGK